MYKLFLLMYRFILIVPLLYLSYKCHKNVQIYVLEWMFIDLGVITCIRVKYSPIFIKFAKFDNGLDSVKSYSPLITNLS